MEIFKIKTEDDKNDMIKELVPYKEVLILKELGFDGECFIQNTSNGLYMCNGFISCYEKNGETLEIKYKRTKIKKFGDDVNIPTFSQAFRWFREKHKLSGTVTHQSFEIFDLIKNECIFEKYPIKSFAQSELDCLRKLIEIIKKK
jgi:hypothetical protein